MRWPAVTVAIGLVLAAVVTQIWDRILDQVAQENGHLIGWTLQAVLDGRLFNEGVFCKGIHILGNNSTLEA